MTRVWTLIPVRQLPELISDMIYPALSSNQQGVRVSGTREGACTLFGDIAPDRSAEFALVSYRLPDDMPCSWHSDTNSLVTSSLEGWLAETNQAKECTASVRLLPTIMVETVAFFSESALRSFQSTRERLLKGRGEWIELVLGERVSGASAQVAFPEAPSLPARNVNLYGNWDRLAAAIATAVTRGGTQLKGNLKLSFDPGSLSLIRQITQKSATLTDDATTSRDYVWLLQELLAAAKKHGIKLGKGSQKAPNDQPDVGCLGQLISGVTQNPTDLAGSTSAENTRGVITDVKLAQEWLITFVLRRILESVGQPDVRKVHEVVAEARSQFISVISVAKGSSRVSEQDRTDLNRALEEIEQNIEHAQQPIAEFRARFNRFPVVVGLAYAFWSWSSDPVKNFSARARDLRADNRPYQFATTLMAACLGGGALPPQSLAEIRWRRWYERVWCYLLTRPACLENDVSPQEIWKVTLSEPVPTGNGLMIRTSFESVPDESLEIENPELAVMALFASALSIPEEHERVARVLLRHIQAPERTLPASLQRQLLLDLSLPVAHPDSSDGRKRAYKGLKATDLEMSYRWANSAQVAETLLRGSTLKAIVSGLSENALSALLADLRPVQRERAFRD